MGIYDRDYVRQRPGGPGPGAPVTLRGRSANFWLITINIAVFVLGALFLSSPIRVKVGIEHPRDIAFEPAHAQVLDGWVTSPTGHLAKRIVDQRTGQVVAFERYRDMAPLNAMGHFSTGKALLELQVWRFVSYQFLHANINHLLVNMIGLFFFGPLVERCLGSRRRYVAFYLTCGIFGALLYLFLNLLGYLMPGSAIPGLLIEDVYTPLIGASASVFGVLMAAAFFAGDAIMLLFLIIPMKVRTGAYLLFGVEVIRLLTSASNAGGSAAHLGGAIAGFYFIRNMHLLEGFFDLLGPPARGSPGPVRRPGGPARPRRRISSKSSPSAPPQRQVDRVLDKVREQGIHSLSDREKEILRRATEEGRRGT